METDRQISLGDYLQILRRRRGVALITFLVVVAVAAIVTLQMTPIYAATTKVEIQPVGDSLGGPFEDSSLQTQVALIKSDAVLKRAAEELTLPSTEPLVENLDVQLVSDTRIVEITITDPLPAEALVRASAVADAYIAFRRERAIEHVLLADQEISERIDEVKRQIDEIGEPQEPSEEAEREALDGQLQALQVQRQTLPEADVLRRGGGSVIDPAIALPDAVRPNLMLNASFAVVVGITLAIAFALLFESLDDRVRNQDEVERRLGATILGHIPAIQRRGPTDLHHLSVADDPGSGTAEAFRTLRTNLRFMAMEHPLDTLMVTSATTGEGKSTVTANLAVSFAQAGKRTILVSADLRRPSIHDYFDLKNEVGLMDALDPDFPLERALKSCGISNLRVMPSGGIPPNPTEVLGSARLSRLMDSLAEISDIVIVDAPPVLGLADASTFAHRTDGVVFVVDVHETTRRQLSHSADQLRKAGGRIIGAVVNRIQPEQGYDYYYYQSNYYTDSTDDDEDADIEKIKPA